MEEIQSGPGIVLRRLPEIVLGFLVATAFWVLVAIIYPEHYGREAEAAKSTPHLTTEAEINERIANYNKTLDWLTAFLVLANIALWWTTWRGSIRQSRDMEASIGVATRAAENAEKALHSLEIPHVYPVEMRFDVEEDSSRAPLIATISVCLKNFGRSPAFLKATYIIVSVTQSERRTPPLYHSGRIPFTTDDVIGDKEIFGPLSVNIPELVPYCSQIRDGTLRLNLHVHHRIDDAMKDSSGRGAWYVWNSKRQKFVAGTELWTEN